MNKKEKVRDNHYEAREIYIYGDATEKLMNTTEGMSPYGRLFL